jgi:hypothetical protein
MMMPPPDTTLGNTETAAKTAAWVRNIALPTGKGGVGALSGVSAQAIIADTSRKYANSTSMSAYYASTLYPTDLQSIRSKILQRVVLMRRLGVLAARDPALFGWGVIEPVKGTYNFTLMDSVIKIAGEYGVPFVGTIVPFSDWASSCNADQTMRCGNLFGSDNGADYFFINQGKIGPVCDTAAFYTFVQKLVERYDGDGVDDMPALKAPIKYWEFSNEPDGMCGGYGDGRQAFPSPYARDQSIMYRAVKAACSTCQVMNGGAIEFEAPTFWNSVLDTLVPKLKHIDIANVHDNVGKSIASSDWDWGKNFYRYVSAFQNKINQYNLPIPVWVTEWGFYSGTPTVMDGGRTVTLPARTEEEYTAIHTKFYAWGKANNLTTFFYDFSGGVGGWGAALVQTGPGGNKAMLLYHTLRLYEYKFRDADSARQISFSTSGNLTLPSGHIRFYKKGIATDVAWGLASLPADITGRKTVTDMYGNVDTLNVSAIKLPLGTNPVIIENVSVASGVQDAQPLQSISTYPNPASSIITVSGECSSATLLRLVMVNVLGETVFTVDCGTVTGAFSQNIPVQNLPQGSYFLRLRTPTLFHSQLVQVTR